MKPQLDTRGGARTNQLQTKGTHVIETSCESKSKHGSNTKKVEQDFERAIIKKHAQRWPKLARYIKINGIA
jgi:hypothetical protein